MHKNYDAVSATDFRKAADFLVVLPAIFLYSYIHDAHIVKPLIVTHMVTISVSNASVSSSLLIS